MDHLAAGGDPRQRLVLCGCKLPGVACNLGTIAIERGDRPEGDAIAGGERSACCRTHQGGVMFNGGRLAELDDVGFSPG